MPTFFHSSTFSDKVFKNELITLKSFEDIYCVNSVLSIFVFDEKKI